MSKTERFHIQGCRGPDDHPGKCIIPVSSPVMIRSYYGRIKLYVAEQGSYEQQNVVGIFDSPERAMGAMPGTKWQKMTLTHFPNWPDRSAVEHTVTWSNDLDRDEAASITEVELTSTGPLRTADEAIVQTYRESDGGWDYLPERLPDAVGGRSYWSPTKPSDTIRSGDA